MEEIFDLRRFLLLLWNKGKLFLLFAIICGLLGGVFGFITGKDNSYIATASASVNTTNDQTDATALTSIMASVKETIASDFFYTGILSEMSQKMSEEEIDTLFGTKKQPSIARLKEVVTVYVRGNLVLVDVIGEEELAKKSSAVAREFAMKRLEQNINNVDIAERDQQTVRRVLQTGATQKKEALKFAVLGFAGGIVLCAIWIFLFDVMSLKIKSGDDLKKYKLPVFAYDSENEKAIASKMVLSILSALSNCIPKPYTIAICTSEKTADKTQLISLSKVISAVCEENGFTAAICDNSPLKFADAKEYRDKCKEKSDLSIFPINDMTTQSSMLACSDGVLLFENEMTSRIDKVEDALETIGNIKKIPLGFAFLRKSVTTKK